MLAPDLVLLDVGLPDASGFDLVLGDARDRGRRRAHLQPVGGATTASASRTAAREGFISKEELTGEAIRSLLR